MTKEDESDLAAVLFSHSLAISTLAQALAVSGAISKASAITAMEHLKAGTNRSGETPQGASIDAIIETIRSLPE